MSSADEAGVDKEGGAVIGAVAPMPMIQVSGTGYITRADGTRVEFTFTNKEVDHGPDPCHHDA